MYSYPLSHTAVASIINFKALSLVPMDTTRAAVRVAQLRWDYCIEGSPKTLESQLVERRCVSCRSLLSGLVMTMYSENVFRAAPHATLHGNVLRDLCDGLRKECAGLDCLPQHRDLPSPTSEASPPVLLDIPRTVVSVAPHHW